MQWGRWGCWRVLEVGGGGGDCVDGDGGGAWWLVV